jgi:hypothetical protein
MNNLPADFDWKLYLELNSDVKQHTESKTGAIQHYLTHGFKEKRIYNKTNLPDNFDWKEYLKLNPDVKKNAFTKNEAINHYLKHGIKENRKYTNSKETKTHAIKTNVEIKSVEENNKVLKKQNEELEIFEQEIDFEDNNDDDDWNSDFNELIEILEENNVDKELINNVIEQKLVGVLSEALSDVL